MLLTVHATAGVFLSQQINNPILTFLVAFCSHFILDIIPHGDGDWIEEYQKKDKTDKIKKIISIIIIDVFSLIALFFITHFYYESFDSPLNVFAGILGAVFPDIMVGFHETTKKFGKNINRLHFYFHDFFGYHLSLNKGLFLQIIILGTLLFAL